MHVIMHVKRYLIRFTLNLQLWDGTLVKQLSSLPNVKRVVSLGTLCAIELKAEGSDAGYVIYEWVIIFLSFTDEYLYFSCHKETFKRGSNDG